VKQLDLSRAKSFEVVGIKHDGGRETIKTFPVHERPTAEAFALALDLSGYEDIFVRASIRQPRFDDQSFKPPFHVRHQPKLTVIADADGRSVSHLFGPIETRELAAQAAVAALGASS
jgi:hypothetical protein